MDRQTKLLFHLNHPAHYHLFKNTINYFRKLGCRVIVSIVKKDILEELVKKEDWECINLFPEGRRSKKLPLLLSAALYLLKTELRMYFAFGKLRPDILMGTEGTIAHAGFLLGIPAILFNEDDTKATPENYLFYPFATKLVMPSVCDNELWKKKKVNYAGYQKLAYLHPNYFTPDKEVIKTFNPELKKYFILRLAELKASHDIGKKGINDTLAKEIISRLEKHGRVFITSERPLPQQFEHYRLKINPQDIFHAMAFAEIYIGDSQSMATESALLGTPSIRYNDFVGILSVHDELDQVYQLTFGFKTGQVQEMLEKIDELLNTPRLKQHWLHKRQRMLVEKQDVTQFFIDFIKGQIKQLSGKKDLKGK